MLADKYPVVFDITTRRGRERVRDVWTGCPVEEATPAQIEQARKAGYEPGPEGYFVGRDPREMTPDELRACQHEPMSPLDALRLKCLDCVGGSANEVRLCVAITCPSWPFRMHKSPWRPPASDEQRDARREAGRRLAALRAQKSSEAP
jgi:hypothetical protein